MIVLSPPSFAPLLSRRGRLLFARVLPALLLVSSLIGISAPARAAGDVPEKRAEGSDEKDRPLATDRPDFTESALTILGGQFQFEGGSTFQWTRDGRSVGFPEGLLRYGITDFTELRFGVPDYNFSRSDRRDGHGFSDWNIGLSLMLGPLPNGDNLSFIPALNIPVGEPGYSSDSLDPEAKLCWTRELGETWNISLMEAPLWTTIDSDRKLAYQQTVSLGHELAESLGMFLEYAGNFAEEQRVAHIAHAGFTFSPDEDSQFDLHGGITTNGPDRQPFIGVGYAIRFR